MYQIGRLCVKIAGRDARKKCLVIEILDDNFVMIDGQTRRRKCNIVHLEPLDKILKIKKSASHKEVVDALKKEKIEVVETKPKSKTVRPTKQRKQKKVTKTETKKSIVKKETKKVVKKTEVKSEKLKPTEKTKGPVKKNIKEK